MRHHTILLLLTGLLLGLGPVHAQEASALISQGDSLLARNNPAKAMEKFNQAVAMGRTADALAGRARGWYFQGKFDKFMEDVSDALRMDSTHVRANYQRALYALRAEDNQGAIRFATRVVEGKAAPDMVKRALAVRGQAEAAVGQTDKAVADLRAGLEGNTDDLDALKTWARLEDEAGYPEASLAILEKLCGLDPKDIGNWSNRGFELNRLERYEEANQVLDKALQLDKDEPVVLSNKAFALMNLGREKEAMNTVNRSLGADRVNPYALRTRAMLYLRKGDRDKACTDLTLAKALGGAPQVDGMIKQYCSGLRDK